MPDLPVRKPCTVRWWTLVTPILTTLLLSLSTNALGQAEVRMKNGAVLYGEVKKLEFAKLSLDTDDFGLIQIDWDPIASLEARGPFTIILENGDIYSGSLQMDSSTATIVGPIGATVPRAEIASLRDFDTGFWNSVSASVDVGANVVRGNNAVTAYNAGLNLGYSTDRTDAYMTASALLNEQTDANDTRRYTTQLSLNRQIVGRLRFGVGTSFETDDNQQLDYRVPVTAFGAFRMVAKQRTRLDLIAGGGPTFEKYTDQDGSSVAEGLVGVAFASRPNSDLDIDLSGLIFPTLSGSDRTRVQSDLVIRIEVVKDFTLNVHTFYRFNSQPPEGVEKSDLGVTVGVGWKY